MHPRENVIEKLQRKIHRMETVSRIDDGSVVRSGCHAIDRMLPDGGYKRGTLLEWFTPGFRNPHHSGGYGVDFLSLLTAAKACEDGGALVIIDPNRQFYPPAAIALGINSGNLIILRPSGVASTVDPENQNDLYWAIDQALRCPAVAAVWGPLDQIGERWFRRFQLSAESSGTLGLFVRAGRGLSRPSWAEVQWRLVAQQEQNLEVNRLTNQPKSDLRELRLKLLRCRGTLSGQMIDLEINTITGSVCESNRTRSDYERHQWGTSTCKPKLTERLRTVSEKGPLSVAAQLADSKNRRHKKRA